MPENEQGSFGKRGADTSEYKTTKWAMLASTLLPVAAMILEGLSDSGVIQNKFWLAIIGGCSATLASLGYSWTRAKTKAVEAQSIAMMAAAKDMSSKDSAER